MLCCAVQEALAKEVHFLQKLKHPNLVTFYGVCLERPMVVMVSQHQVLSTVYAKLCAEMRGKQWAGASTYKLTSHVEIYCMGGCRHIDGATVRSMQPRCVPALTCCCPVVTAGVLQARECVRHPAQGRKGAPRE